MDRLWHITIDHVFLGTCRWYCGTYKHPPPLRYTVKSRQKDESELPDQMTDDWSETFCKKKSNKKQKKTLAFDRYKRMSRLVNGKSNECHGVPQEGRVNS